MEDQLTGKDFWHPNASRGDAEAKMANGKHGCFIIRRSSNPGCLALSHKLGDGTFGHALIQWNGRGYSLEQTTKVYDTIEALIKSLDLRLEDVKKNRPRPAHINGEPVLFQVEAITNYNAQNPEELTMGRGDVINVLRQQAGYHYGELDGKMGKFPAGLTKKVPGSEVPPSGAAAAGGPPPAMSPRSPTAPGAPGGPVPAFGGGGLGAPPPPGAGFAPRGPPMRQMPPSRGTPPGGFRAMPGMMGGPPPPMGGRGGYGPPAGGYPPPQGYQNPNRGGMMPPPPGRGW